MQTYTNNILALQQQDAENDKNFENLNQNQSENDPEERNILRGWHKSSRLVHFFRAIYERKKMWKFIFLFFIFNKSVHSYKRLHFYFLNITNYS